MHTPAMVWPTGTDTPAAFLHASLDRPNCTVGGRFACRRAEARGPAVTTVGTASSSSSLTSKGSLPILQAVWLPDVRSKQQRHQHSARPCCSRQRQQHQQQPCAHRQQQLAASATAASGGR